MLMCILAQQEIFYSLLKERISNQTTLRGHGAFTRRQGKEIRIWAKCKLFLHLKMHQMNRPPQWKSNITPLAIKSVPSNTLASPTNRQLNHNRYPQTVNRQLSLRLSLLPKRNRRKHYFLPFHYRFVERDWGVAGVNNCLCDGGGLGSDSFFQLQDDDLCVHIQCDSFALCF